jgi:hypothetical protein
LVRFDKCHSVFVDKSVTDFLAGEFIIEVSSVQLAREGRDEWGWDRFVVYSLPVDVAEERV